LMTRGFFGPQTPSGGGGGKHGQFSGPGGKGHPRGVCTWGDPPGRFFSNGALDGFFPPGGGPRFPSGKNRLSTGGPNGGEVLGGGIQSPGWVFQIIGWGDFTRAPALNSGAPGRFPGGAPQKSGGGGGPTNRAAGLVKHGDLLFGGTPGGGFSGPSRLTFGGIQGVSGRNKAFGGARAKGACFLGVGFFNQGGGK